MARKKGTMKTLIMVAILGLAAYGMWSLWNTEGAKKTVKKVEKTYNYAKTN